MRINCKDGGYTIELSDITYQYNPEDEKKLKSYPAEDVIIGNGKGNKVTESKTRYYFATQPISLLNHCLQMFLMLQIK